MNSLLIIILMETKDIKQGSSFLDKFKGRANKIDKTGLNNALDPIKLPTPRKEKEPTSHHRLPSLDRKSKQQLHDSSIVDIEPVMQSPQRRKQQLSHLYSNVSPHAKRNSKKLDYLPPINHSPLNTNSKDSSVKPPSRPISDKSENIQRRIFGKYLKLDEEAMKHLEYLQEMDKDRMKRKGSGYSTER